MIRAITREVSPAFNQCELTHQAREPIDVAQARAQHAAYVALLAQLGVTVTQLPAEPEWPDSVFVEDAAVVLETVAVITRPGAPSRRGETASIARALAPWRHCVNITASGTLDGGDVLVLGRRIFVGESSRSNTEGIAQLRAAVALFGYTVTAVPVDGCLHLKSAVTAIAEDAILVNPAWVDPAVFGAEDLVTVDPREPGGANTVRVGDALVVSAAFPHTNERLAQRGYAVHAVDVREIHKAEGAVTCCSLLVTT